MGLARVSGAVLAGGRSSRFGRDKALEPLGGRPLIEWAAGSLAGCGERFLVGGDPARYGFLGLPVRPEPAPGAGPLSGLVGALEAARFERVALTACDMPRLQPAYWAFLASLGPADVVIPAGPGGRLEPLAALYRRRSCLGPAGAALTAGRGRMTGWFEGLAVRVVRHDEVEARFGPGLFLNLNTPADLDGL